MKMDLEGGNKVFYKASDSKISHLFILYISDAINVSWMQDQAKYGFQNGKDDESYHTNQYVITVKTVSGIKVFI